MRPPASWAHARLTLAIARGDRGCLADRRRPRPDEWAAVWGGFIPPALTLGVDGSVAPFWLTPLTATLVHGGFIHLAFNLVMLIFCGRRVESVLGPARAGRALPARRLCRGGRAISRRPDVGGADDRRQRRDLGGARRLCDAVRPQQGEASPSGGSRSGSTLCGCSPPGSALNLIGRHASPAAG